MWVIGKKKNIIVEGVSLISRSLECLGKKKRLNYSDVCIVYEVFVFFLICGKINCLQDPKVTRGRGLG